MPQTSIHYTQGFKYALGWNRFNLSCVGAWPEPNDGFIGKHHSLLCGFWILIMVYLPRSASIIIFWGDMDAVITCLSINGPLLVTIGKLWIMFYYREVMKTIIEMMAEDWTAPLGKEGREVMWKIARITRRISVGSASLTNLLFIAFVVFEICLGMQLKNRMELEPRSSIGALYPAYFPYDTRRLEFFLPTWIGQCICTGFAMVAYAAFDSVIALMVLHVCGQLKLMEMSMTDLINGYTRMNRQEFNWKFCKIIKRHEELNRIAKAIDDSFNSVLLPQLVVCTVSFCFQGYTMLSNLLDTMESRVTVLDLVFAIIFGVYTVLHLYIYCYIGDYLLAESTAIGETYYHSEWYNLSAHEARSLMFIGHRARKPLVITAGRFFIFSKTLFIIILKTSVGYLSMLLTVKDRISE